MRTNVSLIFTHRLVRRIYGRFPAAFLYGFSAYPESSLIGASSHFLERCRSASDARLISPKLPRRIITRKCFSTQLFSAACKLILPFDAYPQLLGGDSGQQTRVYASTPVKHLFNTKSIYINAILGNNWYSDIETRGLPNMSKKTSDLQPHERYA